MISSKLSEIKKHLTQKNIGAIKREKLKLIKKQNKRSDDEEFIKDYNYHVKLSKKIKKYIKTNEDLGLLLNVSKDKYDNIVYIISKVYINKLDVEIPINIKLLTGEDNEVYMYCVYYKSNNKGILYINNFKSRFPNKGYGGLLLKELDNVILTINEFLQKYGYEKIDIIQGHLVADKNVIDDISLRNMYVKYGFIVDENNKITKTIRGK